jgi:hypothetical protein
MGSIRFLNMLVISSNLLVEKVLIKRKLWVAVILKDEKIRSKKNTAEQEVQRWSFEENWTMQGL